MKFEIGEICLTQHMKNPRGKASEKANDVCDRLIKETLGEPKVIPMNDRLKEIENDTKAEREEIENMDLPFDWMDLKALCLKALDTIDEKQAEIERLNNDRKRLNRRLKETKEQVAFRDEYKNMVRSE